MVLSKFLEYLRGEKKELVKVISDSIGELRKDIG